MHFHDPHLAYASLRVVFELVVDVASHGDEDVQQDQVHQVGLQNVHEENKFLMRKVMIFRLTLPWLTRCANEITGVTLTGIELELVEPGVQKWQPCRFDHHGLTCLPVHVYEGNAEGYQSDTHY